VSSEKYLIFFENLCSLSVLSSYRLQVEERSLIYAKTGYNSALELTMSKTNLAVRGFAVFTVLPMGGKNLLETGCRSK
jgi:hypothetical protein